LLKSAPIYGSGRSYGLPKDNIPKFEVPLQVVNRT
jgi:hypothetical protein